MAKNVEALRFIATNLHVQRMEVLDPQLKPDDLPQSYPLSGSACFRASKRYSTVSVGAPAAHAMGFRKKRGVGQLYEQKGSSKIERQLNWRGLGGHDADFTTNRASRVAADIGAQIKVYRVQFHLCMHVSSAALLASLLSFPRWQFRLDSTVIQASSALMACFVENLRQALTECWRTAAEVYERRHCHPNPDDASLAVDPENAEGYLTLRQYADVGFLLIWESLLSTQGKELGMLDDFQVCGAVEPMHESLCLHCNGCGLQAAVESLALFSFLIVDGDVAKPRRQVDPSMPLTAQDLGSSDSDVDRVQMKEYGPEAYQFQKAKGAARETKEGSEGKSSTEPPRLPPLRVNLRGTSVIPYWEAWETQARIWKDKPWFQNRSKNLKAAKEKDAEHGLTFVIPIFGLREAAAAGIVPEDLEGSVIPVTPVLVSQGINEMQTVSDVLRQSSLQHTINKRSLSILEYYIIVSSHIHLRRMSKLQHQYQPQHRPRRLFSQHHSNQWQNRRYVNALQRLSLVDCALKSFVLMKGWVCPPPTPGQEVLGLFELTRALALKTPGAAGAMAAAASNLLDRNLYRKHQAGAHDVVDVMEHSLTPARVSRVHSFSEVLRKDKSNPSPQHKEEEPEDEEDAAAAWGPDEEAQSEDALLELRPPPPPVYAPPDWLTKPSFRERQRSMSGRRRQSSSKSDARKFSEASVPSSEEFGNRFFVPLRVAIGACGIPAVSPQAVDMYDPGGMARRQKRVDILQAAAEIGRFSRAGRVVSCKSAKDRTAMSITLQQARLLHDEHELPISRILPVANAMRAHGVRLANAAKNTGKWKYSFNRVQMRFIPPEYRCPPGTGGGKVT
ncbi:INPP4A [Symbiodinium sp. KB8]|nr:INPP4A [Symbiodinium sp. KB8]